jgi:prepilin-type N-terminal cleavage/methylation domain-containing protein
MNKGFTLMELVMTVVMLSFLSAFTFSVIWQYSQIYADTRQGYIYGEATGVLERISRELRDADLVDPPPTSPPYYINFSLKHGTPQGNTTLTPPYWVQYCTCTNAGRTYLYRFQNTSQGVGNLCGSCPTTAANISLMTGNVMNSGFQVKYFQNDPATVDDDSYEITLQLASRGSASNNPSIRLVTRVSPRNYSITNFSVSRSFGGNYYDEVN